MESRNEKRLKRHKRSIIKGTAKTPRMVVFRSNKHLEVQIIDDDKGHTLVYFNSKTIEKNNNNKNIACEVGQEIAKLCAEKKIKEVVFDRNGYKYHGKIKCIVEEARKKGLKI